MIQPIFCRLYRSLGRKFPYMKAAKTETVYYNVDIKREKQADGRFRLVFLSDLHNCLEEGAGERLLERIETMNPDLVLCGGDMPVAHPGESVKPAAHFLCALAKKHRIYHAFGNHEYRLRLYPDVYGDMYEQYKALLADADICFLDNEKAELVVNNIPLCLYGLSIEKEYYRRFRGNHMPTSYISSRLGDCDPEKVNILLAHHPKYMPRYMEWGADLTLCGHYHGGVMRIGKNAGFISPDPGLFPQNAHGMIRRGEKATIISAGLGEHTIPVRIRNPRQLVAAEVSVHR